MKPWQALVVPILFLPTLGLVWYLVLVACFVLF
jgi:hypothetical protein